MVRALNHPSCLSGKFSTSNLPPLPVLGRRLAVRFIRRVDRVIPYLSPLVGIWHLTNSPHQRRRRRRRTNLSPSLETLPRSPPPPPPPPGLFVKTILEAPKRSHRLSNTAVVVVTRLIIVLAPGKLKNPISRWDFGAKS